MTTQDWCKEGCDDRMDALQRYLETKIESEREIIEERFKAQAHALMLQEREVEHRFQAAQEALRLQALEYARRLEGLNQAHERADKLAEKIIGRDMYEQDRLRNASDHETFKHELTVIQTRSLTFASAWGIAAVIASLGLSLIFHFIR